MVCDAVNRVSFCSCQRAQQHTELPMIQQEANSEVLEWAQGLTAAEGNVEEDGVKRQT